MENQEWKKLIQTAARSILSLHTKPDGDSIGSNLALLHILKNHGHTVTLVTRDPVSAVFSFLAGFNEIQQVRPADIRWNSYDLFWALDMSSPSMLDELFTPPNLPIAVIDHHASNAGWGTHNLIEPDAVSTTQVLYTLFTQLQIKVDAAVATCLYTGLMTDTVFMKYVDAPQPFRIAANLIETGIDSSQVLYNIGQQIDVDELRASADVLSRAERYNSFVVFVYPNNIVTKYSLTAPAEFVVNFASQITGTDFGLVMFESEPNVWRLEFRARKREFDVSKIAKKLGGGGHVAAAGVRRIAGSKSDILDQIVKASTAKT